MIGIPFWLAKTLCVMGLVLMGFALIDLGLSLFGIHIFGTAWSGLAEFVAGWALRLFGSAFDEDQ